jgi:hypothetical protein
MDSATAVLIGSALATTGWVYTSRRACMLSRKQHTINVLLQAGGFNKEFNVFAGRLASNVREKRGLTFEENADQVAFRTVANYYEFIAGIRGGEFDENLIRDCLRAPIVQLFTYSSDFIWKLRDNRSRQTIYEHFEWLYLRWEKNPPPLRQKILEYVLNRPLPSRRAKPLQ